MTAAGASANPARKDNTTSALGKVDGPVSSTLQQLGLGSTADEVVHKAKSKPASSAQSLQRLV